MSVRFIWILMAILLLSTPVWAQTADNSFETDSLTSAIKSGHFYYNGRYRLEAIDQANLPDDAYASTLRSALGFETQKYQDTKALIEFENISVLGKTLYNDFTNGETNRPLVLDQGKTEVNQAYLEYSGIKDRTIKLGRQDLSLGNNRFISGYSWRQNAPSHDGIRVDDHALFQTVDLIYGYSDKVHRGINQDVPNGTYDGNIYYVNAIYPYVGGGAITGYTYLMDFNSNPDLSNKTIGANINNMDAKNKEDRFLYLGEYAKQTDYTNNPTSFDLNYYRLEAGAKTGDYTYKLGYENLGGDGTIGLITAIGSSFSFDGLGDVVNSATANGLQDYYLTAAKNWDEMNLVTDAQLHDFRSDKNSIKYGKELDLRLQKQLSQNFSAGLLYADYVADAYAADTQKLAMTLNAKF